MKYYSVLGLDKLSQVSIHTDKIEIELEELESLCYLSDDHSVNAAKERGQLIWASGGGSLLINDYYLAVVQRSDKCLVNPGLYSLFTGRADGINEVLEPRLIIRELFEALVLFESDTLLQLEVDGYEDVYHRVNQRNIQCLNHNKGKVRSIYAKRALLEPKEIIVKSRGNMNTYRSDVHISNSGEINILSLLEAKLTLEFLHGLDGEILERVCNDELKGREIFLCDLRDMSLLNISGRREAKMGDKIGQSDMTEHLWHLVKLIRKRGI